MFGRLKIDQVKINCNKSYSTIKRELELYANNDADFLYKAEMECICIVKSNVLDFNITIATILISFAAFFISLFKDVNITNPVNAFLLFFAAVLIIVFFSINLHMKRSNAEKILYVIKKMEAKSN